MPFGESMAEQKAGGYSTKYRFTGKEVDEETGLYYFGARYYDPRISLWYGVDPRTEKYPNFSSYTYTFNNPIKFVDPDGRAPQVITPETIWDIINVGMGVASFGANIASGNVVGAVADGIGLAYDAFATIVPILPAGASTTLGVYRLTNLSKKALGSVSAAQKLFAGNKKFQSLNSSLKRAFNAIDKETDIGTLAGSIKEKLGIPLDVIKKEAIDGKFDHTKKLENGIQSMKNAVDKINETFDGGGLSKEQINVLSNTRDLLNTRVNKLESILKEADKVAKKIE